jgi:hypothetical protein
LKKAIIAIFIILFIIIGICVGLLIKINIDEKSQNNTTNQANSTKATNTSNSTSNNTGNNTSSNQNATNNTVNNTSKNGTNNSKTSNSKKIDESKDWVYNAEYSKENKEIRTENETLGNKTFQTDKDLIVPYININSQDAKKANEEIKELYEEKYSEFGEYLSKSSDGELKAYSCPLLEYKVYENQNILSIVIYNTERMIVTNSSIGSKEIYIHTYNFNLDTLEVATLDEMAVLCKFSSGNEVTKKIKDWEESQKNLILEQENGEKYLKNFIGAQEGQFYINEDGFLYFICRIINNYEMDKELGIAPNMNIRSVVQVKNKTEN